MNNDITKIAETIEYLTLSEIKESPVQRRVCKKQIAEIVKNFDKFGIMGVISVAKFNGEFVVVDGMHRIKAMHVIAEERGFDPTQTYLPVVKFEAKTEQELYDLFVKLHTNYKPYTKKDIADIAKQVKA